MSRFHRNGGFTLASSLVATAFLSTMPASAQSFGAASANTFPSVSAAAPAGDSALAQFREVLQRYGSFQTHPRYGQVWLPAAGTVAQGWSPYPACHWSYDSQQQAWTYEDPTEWGSIVHHFGRWAFDQQAGWMWIADTAFGPGWVYWRNDARSVSWVALSPEIDGADLPRDGWQMQDAATFNSGCRPVAPAPVSYAPPAPAYSSVAYAPRYAGIAVPPTVFVGRPMPPIQVERPFPREPRGPERGDICSRHPWLAFCRHRTGSVDKGGVDCRFPSFGQRPECRASGTGGGSATSSPAAKNPAQQGSFCKSHRFVSFCRGGVASSHPGGVNHPPVGPHPIPVFNPGPVIGGVARVPASHLRPVLGRMARFPVLRGGPVFGGSHRTGGFQPGGGFRPPLRAISRPSFPRGSGGMRFAGRFRR